METNAGDARTFGFMGAGRIVEILLDSLGPAIGEGRGLIWNRTKPRAERLAQRHGLRVQETPGDLARNSDRVLLALKPKAVASVLTQASPGMSPDTVLVSMVAGVSIARLRGYFATPPRIIRIMPNIALSVGLGMTAVCADEGVPPEDVEEILGIFRTGRPRQAGGRGLAGHRNRPVRIRTGLRVHVYRIPGGRGRPERHEP